MDERKERVKTKLAAARKEFLDALNGLTDEQWELRGYAEGSEWTVADVLRHVADSERGMTGLIARIKTGGEGVPDDFDLERWNRRVVEKLADKSPRAMLDSMTENRAALLSLIDSLKGEDWDKKGRHASLKIMTIEEVCHLIADHETLHLAGIREALSK